ncbi:sigma-54 dependent transcriptional regulator [Chitinivorax sp. B]|uniref:sigma-54-dependent transcriptional regulator n=1 Tax=Chitinivorax sp. B TaxID=2502235 RepID=UPI0010F60709|nr:sigma-54 dependent transcriptional regulator [Chitinivorax sp. B]
MPGKHILIVDDEIGIRELLSEILQDEGYDIKLAENAEQARLWRNQTRPDLVLLDIWMPDCDGVSLLKEWANNGQLTMPVVMMSGHGTIETAVEATRIGAIDYLEKPIGLQKLLTTVSRAIKTGVGHTGSELSLASLGKGNAVQELKRQLDLVQPLKTPILLLGEPGVGFESCARFLHHSNTPFVAPEQIERALDAPADLLQQANNGVLFLREVGRLGARAQQGLLQVLAKLEKFNIRLVCATCRPLVELTQDRNFDPGLFAAISVLQIPVPSLKAHREDVPDLAHQILDRLVEEKKVPTRRFSVAALNALRNHDWPGNLEQLRNLVATLAMTSISDEIGVNEVNRLLAPYAMQQTLGCGEALDLPLREARDIFERHYFEHHIKLENGNMSRVAEKVGLERTHLYRKLKQLGIRFSKRVAEDA